MKETVQILKEQVQHFNKITRIARYDQRATYQSHYLGMLWEVLSPTLQVLIYYFVFGIRMNGASSMDAGVPYIVWMLAGMIPWFFISAIIISGANSIYSNLSLVSRVKFPMSILPSITIFKSLYSYATMLVILLGFLFINHLFPTIYWTQFFYYFVCMCLFLYAISLLNATITILFRDYQLIIGSAMRLLFFISGAVIDVTANPDSLMTKMLKLNPFVYIIEGFRDSFFSRQWFFAEPWWTAYFWGITLLVLGVGSLLHLRFKDRFMDYL
ncbi:ABC transporter permease [Listeria rocourtiae]|uniref:ABC transporter permease n=1 Tax=Listeria rocourtiae TaxID=647910 RepID=UPI0016298C1B|nr:ABC transporter permease [Listeria rocourtiae]MBC1605227.1 ABC transporter permease [Listeria rocourtiae]